MIDGQRIRGDIAVTIGLMRAALFVCVLVTAACGSPLATTTPQATGFGPTQWPMARPTGVATPEPSRGCGFIPEPRPPDPLPSSGCATPPPDFEEPTSPPSARELPPPGTQLEPGRYTRSAFQPRVTFEIGPGWTAVQAVPGFFDIQDEPGSLDVVAVQFANVVGAASADEAVGEISEKSYLNATIAETVMIDGLSGHRVTVQTLDPADTQPPIFRDVLTARPGALAIASGRRLEITLVDVEGGVLAILVGGSIAEWDRALQLTRPVLDSIVIED